MWWLVTIKHGVWRTVVCRTYGMPYTIQRLPKRGLKSLSASFQQTLLWAISPTAPADDAPIAVKKEVRKQVLEVAATLGMRKVKGFVKRLQQSTVVRREIFANQSNPTLSIVNKRGIHSRYTPEFIVEIRKWLVEYCQKIIQSPNAKDSIWIKCPVTGLKSKERKHFFLFSVREVLYDLIENFPGAKNEKGEVIISDTALRAIMPKNIQRMSESQKQMCGCDICLNAYQFILALNSWRSRKKTVWENDLRKARENGRTPAYIAVLQKRIDHFKEDAFPDGRRLWDTCTDAMYSVAHVLVRRARILSV